MSSEKFGIISNSGKYPTDCQLCSKTLGTFKNRRHHCRKCDRLVCVSCSSHKYKIKAYDGLKRVCDDCYKVLKKKDETKNEFVLKRQQSSELLYFTSNIADTILDVFFLDGSNKTLQYDRNTEISQISSQVCFTVTMALFEVNQDLFDVTQFRLLHPTQNIHDLFNRWEEEEMYCAKIVVPLDNAASALPDFSLMESLIAPVAPTLKGTRKEPKVDSKLDPVEGELNWSSSSSSSSSDRRQEAEDRENDSLVNENTSLKENVEDLKSELSYNKEVTNLLDTKYQALWLFCEQKGINPDTVIDNVVNNRESQEVIDLEESDPVVDKNPVLNTLFTTEDPLKDTLKDENRIREMKEKNKELELLTEKTLVLLKNEQTLRLSLQERLEKNKTERQQLKRFALEVRKENELLRTQLLQVQHENSLILLQYQEMKSKIEYIDKKEIINNADVDFWIESEKESLDIEGTGEENEINKIQNCNDISNVELKNQEFIEKAIKTESGTNGQISPQPSSQVNNKNHSILCPVCSKPTPATHQPTTGTLDGDTPVDNAFRNRGTPMLITLEELRRAREMSTVECVSKRFKPRDEGSSTPEGASGGRRASAYFRSLLNYGNELFGGEDEEGIGLAHKPPAMEVTSSGPTQNPREEEIASEAGTETETENELNTSRECSQEGSSSSDSGEGTVRTSPLNQTTTSRLVRVDFSHSDADEISAQLSAVANSFYSMFSTGNGSSC